MHTIREIQADRRASVREVAPRMGTPAENVRRMRHRNGYHYYDPIAIPRLTNQGKAKKVTFAQKQIANNDNTPIDLRMSQ
jgi:hypothetical protein